MLPEKALVKHGFQISAKFWYSGIEDNMKEREKK